MLNVTNIPAPRVSIIDEQTGLISREWYRFFLNLFTLVGQGNNQTSLDDLQVGPPAQNINILVSGSSTDLAPPPAPITSIADNQALLPANLQLPVDNGQALLPSVVQALIQSYADLAPPVIPPSIPTNGTVTSVDVSGGTTGMSFTGGPITTSGTITMSGTLGTANGGTGATSLTGAGIVTLTDSQVITGQKNFTSFSCTYAGATYATTNAYFGESSAYAAIGGVNGVVLASGATYPGTGRYVADAVSFRPYATTTYSCGTLSQRWTTVYSQNLDLTGVVAAGTWNGSTITTGYGGTGVTSTPSNGQLLIGNGSGYSLSTLTAGTNVTITNSSGGITIAATGGTGTVTSVAASGGTTGLTFSGSPITTSGTLTLGGTLAAANGGTGASSLTGAGIVTTTNTQTISGQKNFTNFSCTYAGTTYATTNAYFGENSSYAVIGGVNGVVLASGGTYPGTSRYVGDSTAFRPSTTATYSSGTLSQRWTTVYSQNLDLSGVVAAGTWNGSTIGISYGGTGSTTQSGARTSLGVPAAPTGSSAQLLANNGAGEFSNVSVGTGLSYSGGTLSATNTGTVTSVSGSGGSTGLTLTGGPITTSGTLTLGGTLATGSGGTGASSLTGAGIVTTTDTQTISGVKTFSSTSNAFVGATYKTSNAYFYEDTSYAVLGGVNGVLMAYGSYPGTVIFAGDSNTWRPTVDNTRALGTASFRYTVVYATTGTINTSDASQKQQVRELSDAEQRVAQRVKKLIRAFKWNDAVEAKGEDARIHFGVIAQDVQEAFAAEGLDASKYGLFCSDTWTNSDGSSQTRLGVRYSELLAFVIAAL